MPLPSGRYLPPIIKPDSGPARLAASTEPAVLQDLTPGDSYLVRKIEGPRIVANRMPLGAAPLTQAQIDLVREWVLDGAPDN